MNDDRWRRVEELFDHAAALPPEERGVFLDNACAGDERLRQEVESLLAHDQSQNNLVRAAIADAIREARDSRSLSDLVGKQIGPYSILGLLGQGGMGVVYEARDSRLERHVAIKILSEYLMNGMLRQRFEREARAASALNHPNICSIYDAGEWEGRPFLVMELLEGRTLREHVDTQPRHIREILGLTSEILEALQAAHAKGIVHRDIKPANIFVTKSGHVKLLDFGLASRLGLTVELEESTLPDKLTDPGSVIGTIAYMSPEQARGEAVDARGDLWSLGVVLYEMVTGDQPFVGPTSAVVFDSILNKTPIPVRERNPELPAGLERIIAKLLEKDRELRYQSAAEVQADLGNPVFTTAKRARSSASGLSGKAGFKDALGTTRRNVSAPSIAILPFANLSGDKEQEYFSDGLAEEITNALSQIPGLKVTARTSA
ncbi:MAG: protein kinase, partial [Acidobacteriia bacterium]|nr:protein kinase [Terriglobia bacterium]